MNMQPEPLNKVANCLLRLGASGDEADKALLLLGSDGATEEEIQARVEQLVELCQACGCLQSAKLAYSLALRSGCALEDGRCALLAEALGCSDCVPAGVRLWKTAIEADVPDPLYLATAARLGQDGSEQVRILKILKAEPGKLGAAAELARRLRAPGWECDGSWGGTTNPKRGLVWWDNAVPDRRQAYGMTLSIGPLSLKDRLGARFVCDVRHQIHGTTDRCHLECSVDGKRWKRLVKFEGESDWETLAVDLSSYGERSIYLRFHVLSGGHREGRGIEVANSRLESVRVTRQERLRFEELSQGWSEDGFGEGAASVLIGKESESGIETRFSISEQMVAPTVFLDARVQASSVYAEATVELLDDSGQALLKESLTPTTDWEHLSMLLPVEGPNNLGLRLWSRFAKRREDDGFRVRAPRLLSGSKDSRETLYLYGGYGDGAKEQRALLELIESGSQSDLEELLQLRLGLPDLASALTLYSLCEDKSQIPALLLLFSRLKEGAVNAFQLLSEFSDDNDLLLQARVLLQSGMESYASTRDHLGDGLLPIAEFEDNCRLYLRLRESWSEEEARRGFSLLFTPVAAESAQERRERFIDLLETHPGANDFARAWAEKWVAS